ncbi:hypothetical protein KEM52_006055 [Ascosphaera acerosa]|nr:hypothetical protein KEM52_006055 [Ascosphaera acerosa]
MKKFMLRRDASVSLGSPSLSSKKKDKDEFVPPPPSALELMLARAGPVRDDGSDKFFGFENPQFGNICYCNSILQCLYYSRQFRHAVLNYPRRSPPDSLRKALDRCTKYPTPESIREDLAPPPKDQKEKGSSSRNPGAIQSGQSQQQQQQQQQPAQSVLPQKPEDKNSSEYKKRVAMATRPILNTQDNSRSYGMQESMFTALKDLFEAVAASKERTGVIRPQQLLEVLRREYEMFRTAMHQDAHEFLNILLNEVVTSVEAYASRPPPSHSSDASSDDQASGHGSALSQAVSSVENSHGDDRQAASLGPGPTTRWVHELFEGILTSETQCLTCETKSRRDEVFLDLSVDLEQHASVTSCLRKFSAEETLCERDKFHCDTCGGLQEAEKRMIIKRLPRILALHLKRFKYTEDLQRLQKLFHSVVYPYYLRLFNTTDDAEDPDRLYELYAVVVHIGGGPHHGHYVSIIKTEHDGWMLFDDELVEPVDKNYVRNFFGDKPGLACAYVLFYQETTMEKMQRDQEAEARREQAAAAAEAATTSAATGAAGGAATGKDGDAAAHMTSALHRVTSWQRRDSTASASLASPHPSTKLNGSPVNLPAVAPASGADAPSAGETGISLTPELGRDGSFNPSQTGDPRTSPVPTAATDRSASTVPTPGVTSRKGEVLSKKERAREEKERKAAEKAERERQAKERELAEKQRRKENKEAMKRQEQEMRAALEASRQSKAEEDRRAKERQKSDPSASAVGGGAASAGGLGRFRITSKSFGLSVKTGQTSADAAGSAVPKSAYPAGQSGGGKAFFEKTRRVSSFTPAPQRMDQEYTQEQAEAYDDDESSVGPLDTTATSPRPYRNQPVMPPPASSYPPPATAMHGMPPPSSPPQQPSQPAESSAPPIGTPVVHAFTHNAAYGHGRVNGIDSVLQDGQPGGGHRRGSSYVPLTKIDSGSRHAANGAGAGAASGSGTGKEHHHHGFSPLHGLRSTASFLHGSSRRDSHPSNDSVGSVSEVGAVTSPKSPPPMTAKRSRFSFRKKSSLY